MMIYVHTLQIMLTQHVDRYGLTVTQRYFVKLHHAYIIETSGGENIVQNLVYQTNTGKSATNSQTL